MLPAQHMPRGFKRKNCLLVGHAWILFFRTLHPIKRYQSSRNVTVTLVLPASMYHLPVPARHA